MKIAIVHDHLGFKGGGERTVLLLAMHLKADFITAYAHPDTFPEYQKALGSLLHPLSKKVLKIRVVRFFWLRFLFWKRRKIFRGYDLLVASGQTATEAVASYSRPEATRVVYTHTTPRRVFDQYESSKKMYPFFLRPAYALFARFWKCLYLKSIKKFNVNIANSNNVRDRIKNHTGSDASAVVWPPILTEQFKWRDPEGKDENDYFFSWGRVDEAKRIELIVKSFKKMPGEKLVVASGGPRLQAVKDLAKGFPNIRVLGWVDEKDLKSLVGKCRAAVYIPIDEDAGMTHLEANAAGKPVLGVAEGGLIESTIEGQTGILIKANPKEEDIIEAAKTMTREWCLERKKLCEEHAEKFAAYNFFKKMEGIISRNDPAIPLLGIDASRYEDPRYPGEGRRTGVEVYVKNLVDSLVIAAKDYKIRLRLYVPRTMGELPLEIQKVIPGKNKWTRKHLSLELKTSPPEWFFTPGYYIPKKAPDKSFATIHDVIFKSSPKNYTFKERLSQEYAVRKNLSRSKKIITVSENTRSELIRLYHVKPDKISAVPMAYSPQFDISRECKRKDQVVYIGRIEKKKSVDILVKAFFLFQKTNPEWKLVLAGKPGHGSNEIVKLIEKFGLKDKVRLPGFISDAEKWELLAESSFLVHPSANEGSCIPLFEAWDARIPAIVTDAPVLKEVAKEAALHFKSYDQEDLALKMNELANSHSLRLFLTGKGAEALKNMSWDASARDILDIITK